MYYNIQSTKKISYYRIPTLFSLAQVVKKCVKLKKKYIRNANQSNTQHKIINKTHTQKDNQSLQVIGLRNKPYKRNKSPYESNSICRLTYKLTLIKLLFKLY